MFTINDVLSYNDYFTSKERLSLDQTCRYQVTVSVMHSLILIPLHCFCTNVCIWKNIKYLGVIIIPK